MVSKIFISFIYIISMICQKLDCEYVHLVEKNYGKQVKNTGLQEILKKYLNPLRRLTEQLPDHAIEMQIEVKDVAPRASVANIPARRLAHFRKKDKAVPMTTDTTTKNVRTKKTPAVTLPNISLKTETDHIKTTTRKPIFMEDLNKALKDLEERLTKKNPENSVGKPGIVHLISKEKSGMNEILEMLEKATAVEKHVSKPDLQDLEWWQIKLPKNA